MDQHKTCSEQAIKHEGCAFTILSEHNYSCPEGPDKILLELQALHCINDETAPLNDTNKNPLESELIIRSVDELVMEIKEWNYNVKQDLGLNNIRTLLKKKNRMLKHIQSLPLGKIFKKLKESKHVKRIKPPMKHCMAYY